MTETGSQDVVARYNTADITAVVSFCLLNSKEFTAKCYSHNISANVLPILYQAGGRVDPDSHCWVFPLNVHEKLKVNWFY